jgi:hypothetical protein
MIVTKTRTLSQEEIVQRSEKLVEKLNNIDEIKHSQKTLAARAKAEIAEIQTAADSLRREITAGETETRIDCKVERDWRTREIVYRDSITGDVVKREPFRGDETPDLFDTEVGERPGTADFNTQNLRPRALPAAVEILEDK